MHLTTKRLAQNAAVDRRTFRFTMLSLVRTTPGCCAVRLAPKVTSFDQAQMTASAVAHSTGAAQLGSSTRASAAEAPVVAQCNRARQAAAAAASAFASALLRTLLHLLLYLLLPAMLPMEALRLLLWRRRLLLLLVGLAGPLPAATRLRACACSWW